MTNQSKRVDAVVPSFGRIASGWLPYALTAATVLIVYTVFLWWIKSYYESDRVELIAQREVETLSALTVLTQLRRDNAVAAVGTLADALLETGLLDGPVSTRSLPNNDFRRYSAVLKDWVGRFPEYHHVRIISSAGWELARINNHQGLPVQVPQDQLQNKASRNYVFNGFLGDAGILQVGDLNLNQEYGRIERPIVPVIRLILPLGAQDRAQYLLVANLRVTELLKEYLEIGSNPPLSYVYVVREDGVFVTGDSRFAQYEFSDQLSDGEGVLADVLPELWQAIQTELSGQLLTEDGLFLFSSLDELGFVGGGDRSGFGGTGIIHLPPESLHVGALDHSVPIRIAVVVSYALILLVIWALWRQHRAKNQMARQNAEQTRMFGIISHELRTPASALDMMIQNEGLIDEDRHELQSASRHLLNVIDDLRAAVQPDGQVVLTTAPFSLSRLVSEVERQISPLYSNSQISFHFELPDWEPDQYLSDAYRLRVVLTNLLRNANYHSEAKRVWLTVRRVQSLEDGDGIRFTVEDDGKGIPVDRADGLFEAFTRGETKSGGTGVGLYIVRQWIQLLGGDVKYRPSEHGGACFEVSVVLPKASAREADSTDGSSADKLKARVEGLRVLFVEDDRILRKLGVSLLEKHYGMNVTVACDGAEALEIFKGQEFDLLITDYFMPKMNGTELIRTVRNDGSRIPAVAVTAASAGNEAHELYDAGADTVLIKPFSIDKFDDVIAGLIDGGRLSSRDE